MLVPLFAYHGLPLFGDWVFGQVVVFAPFLELFCGVSEVAFFGDVVFGVGSGRCHWFSPRWELETAHGCDYVSFYGMELRLLGSEYSTWTGSGFPKGKFEVPGFMIVEEV